MSAEVLDSWNRHYEVECSAKGPKVRLHLRIECGHGGIEGRRLHGELPRGKWRRIKVFQSMVLRASPVMFETAARPPHLTARASLAAITVDRAEPFNLDSLIVAAVKNVSPAMKGARGYG